MNCVCKLRDGSRGITHVKVIETFWKTAQLGGWKTTPPKSASRHFLWHFWRTSSYLARENCLSRRFWPVSEEKNGLTRKKVIVRDSNRKRSRLAKCLRRVILITLFKQILFLRKKKSTSVIFSQVELRSTMLKKTNSTGPTATIKYTKVCNKHNPHVNRQQQQK